MSHRDVCTVDMERTNTERQNSERKTDWRVGSNYKDLLLILKRTGKEENSTVTNLNVRVRKGSRYIR